jgi:hypothetical protein
MNDMNDMSTYCCLTHMSIYLLLLLHLPLLKLSLSNYAFST